MCPRRPGTAEPSGPVPEWAAPPLPRGGSGRSLAEPVAFAVQVSAGHSCCRMAEPRRQEEEGSDPEPLRFPPGPSSHFLSCHSHCLASCLSLYVSPFPGRSAHFLKVSRVFLSVRGSLAEPAVSASGAGGCAARRGQLPLARQGDEGSGASDT